MEKNNPKNKIPKFFSYLKLFYYEVLYFVHLRFRYVHDLLYKDNRSYKRISDYKYTRHIRRASIFAFIFAYITFYALGNVWPEAFKPKVPVAVVGTTQVIWDTQGHLDGTSAPSNSNVTPPLTLTQTPASSADTSSSAGFIKIAPTAPIDSGTGADGAATVSGSVNIKSLYENDNVTGATTVRGTNKGLNKGVGTYNPGTGAIPNFTNLTLSGTITTNTLLAISIKVSGALSGDGSFNADAGGYNATAGPTPGGTGLVSPPLCSDAACGGGGGGAGHNATGGAGSTYSTRTGGAGGSTYSYSNFPAYGSGGGNGGGQAGSGGSGGGVVVLGVSTYSFTGTISSKGGDGLPGAVTDYEWGDFYASGGGGAGGSISLKASSGTIDPTKLSVMGGSGGILADATLGITSTGGKGSGGRVAVQGALGAGQPDYSAGSSGNNGGSADANSYNIIQPYQTSTAVKGYKIDAGSGFVSSWSSVSWITNSLPSNTTVKFRVRNATTEAGLTAASWSSYFTQSSAGSTSGSGNIGSDPNISSSRWLETEISMSSDGASTPVVDNFTVSFDALDAVINANMSLKKSDGTYPNKSDGTSQSSGLVVGGYTNETSIKIVAANLTCGTTAGGNLCSNSTGRKPEVEVKPIGSAFDGTGTVVGTSTTSTGENQVGEATVTGLVSGTSYHVQVRTQDAQGRVSGWTSYGSNAENEADFTVEQTAPTIASYSVTSASDNATYVDANNRILKAIGTFNDTGGSSGTLQVQFSQDGTNWGKYSGSGTTNTTTTDWTNYFTVTASPDTQNIANAWYLEGADEAKTIYVRAKDGAGNVSGQMVDTTLANGTNSGTTVKNGALRLGPLNTTQIISDSSDGHIDLSEWCVSPDTTSATATAFISNANETDQYVFFRFDTSGITDPDTVTLNLTVTGISWQTAPLTVWQVSDYGTLDCSDVGTEIRTVGTFPIGQTGTMQLDIAPSWISGNVFAIRVGAGESALSLATSENGNISIRPRISVSVSPPYQASGNFTSRVFDSALADPSYGNISWIKDNPTNTILGMEVRGGDTATPDGTWTAFASVTNGGVVPAGAQTKRYLQYKASLTTSDTNVTPILYDVFIEHNTATSDSITLDTTPPTNLGGLAGYTDSGKGTAITTNVWTQETTPYFEWTANTDPDFNHYEYYYGTDPSGVPSPSLGATANYQIPSPQTEGIYYFRVVALDGAGNTSPTPTTFTYKTDNTAPSTVANLASTGSTETSISLSWDTTTDTSGITGYRIMRKLFHENWGDPSETTYNIGAQSSYTDNTDLEAGLKYSYRIKALNGTDLYSISWSPSDSGLGVSTYDTVAPSIPTTVTAVPCQANGTNCSNVANAGFEMKLAWTASTDAGSGVEHYKIYRRQGSDSINMSDYTLAGVLPVSGPTATIYYDNDTNNDDATTWSSYGKTLASTRLNDYTTYHYRIVAVDTSDLHNPSAFYPIVPIVDPSGIRNHTQGNTVDVTAPSIPTNIVATAAGLDTSNEAQKINLTWTASTDAKAAGRTPEGNGSGISGYQIYRATGDINGPTEAFASVAYSATASYTNEGLNEFTYYYYKIKAIDSANSSSSNDTLNNTSDFSVQASARTSSNSYPSIPTGVTVTAKTGDPNEDSEVGQKITVSFTGSKIKYNTNSITGYEIYRANANYATENEWFSSATKVHTISGLSVPGYTPPTQTGDEERSWTDTVPTDSTTYYYKIRGIGNNPDLNPATVYSSLSAITVGTLHSGWDTAPDATPPTTPANVQVKNLNPGEDYVRNVITWERIAIPLRNGTSDFKEYRVYRRAEDEVGFAQLTLPGGVNPLYDPDKAKAIDTNYYVDAIAKINSNKTYYYYVTALDDAANFKYPAPNASTAVNAFANESTASANQSVNPGQAFPVIQALDNGKKSKITVTGVSSATVYWETDQSADTIIAYRKSGTNDAFITAGTEGFAETHTVTLQALVSNTPYEYKLRSRNHLMNEVEATGDVLAPLRTSDFSISSINAITTTSTSTITWTTNIAADSCIEYKLEKIVGENEEKSSLSCDTELVTSHSVDLKGLKNSRTYTYKVRSRTADNYIAESSFLTFKTKANDLDKFSIAPAESNLAEENITATTAQIVWDTTIPTTSWVDYGNEPGLYSQSAGDDALNTHHAVKLQNLTPGKKYYYRVRGKDENGLEVFSPESSFTAVLQPEVSNIVVKNITPYSVTITFDTNVDTLVSVNYGKDTNYGQRLSKAKQERNHSITLKELDDNSIYHLQIVAVDQFKNETKSKDISVSTPLDTQGPVISEVKVDILPADSSSDTSSIIISWTSDKPASTQVEYDDKTASEKYDNRTIEDASLSTTHTVVIKDLATSTNYRFRILSKDKRGNLTKTKPQTFITPTQEKSLLQIIIKSFEDTFSWVRNVPGIFGRMGDRVKGR